MLELNVNHERIIRKQRTRARTQKSDVTVGSSRSNEMASEKKIGRDNGVKLGVYSKININKQQENY